MNFLNNSRNLLPTTNNLLTNVRYASKKTGGSTKNPQDPHNHPKHRGWKRQDGSIVPANTLLVLQTKPRFFPGLNVTMGRNMSLVAQTHGKVYVTCEKVEPNWDSGWIQKFYSDRGGHPFYKKYFNILPEKQHQRFRLVDEN